MSIFLAILSVIGKILLGILIAALIILLLILLVPVRYETAEQGEIGAYDVRAKASWLLGILSVRIHVRKEKGAERYTEKEFRVFGFSPSAWHQRRMARKKEKRREKKIKQLDHIREKDPERFEQLREEARIRREEKEARRMEEERRKQAEKEAEQEAKKKENLKERVVRSTRKQLRLYEKIVRKLIDLHKKIFWKIIDAIRALAAMPSAIVEKTAKIVSKITSICDTIGEWTDFLSDLRTRKALRIIKKRALKILKHVRPKKLEGYVHFGFDDPFYTGEALAAASAFYPLYGGKIILNPDFSGEALDGELKASGRVRIGTVLYHGLLTILSPDVRYVWRTVKKLRAEKTPDNGEESEEIREAS